MNKVNHLKRLISSLRIGLWLIHAGCFSPPHVGTDIVALHPNVIETLTAVNHHPNRCLRQISEMLMPHNVQVIFLSFLSAAPSEHTTHHAGLD